EDALVARRAAVLDQDPVDAGVAVDPPAGLRNARDRRDELRRLAVVRATELRPPATDAVDARGGRDVRLDPERLAPLPDQAVVLVEEPLLGDVDPQLPLDRVEVGRE